MVSAYPIHSPEKPELRLYGGPMHGRVLGVPIGYARDLPLVRLDLDYNLLGAKSTPKPFHRYPELRSLRLLAAQDQ